MEEIKIQGRILSFDCDGLLVLTINNLPRLHPVISTQFRNTQKGLAGQIADYQAR